MNRSASEVVKQDPALLPEQDGARAVMIVGKDGGVPVVLRINALSMEDTAALGTGGVYLQIAGELGKSIAAAIAAAAKSKDVDVCVYLDDGARRDLVEQLSRFETILSLHALMAKQAAGETEEQRAMAQLRARAAPAGARRSRAILRTVEG